ncbi:MAG: hypothetical protein KBD21_00475 [Candidatus Pacebacteria bacterium]|nr:hypothetical protein [Candidatus Paceibacterota bacterium]
MKYYIYTIKFVQNMLVGGSVLYLMSMPVLLGLYPEYVSRDLVATLFLVSLLSVTFVMLIRPLADLLPRQRWLRSLVILRKGFGVVSASIIVSFILGKMVAGGVTGYLSALATSAYWSLDGFALLAHLGDITAIILLLTSNNFSKRVLGKGWKRVQKLAYIYFYAGASYEVFAFESSLALVCIALVTALVLAAFVRNRFLQKAKPVPVKSPVSPQPFTVTL